MGAQVVSGQWGAHVLFHAPSYVCFTLPNPSNVLSPHSYLFSLHSDLLRPYSNSFGPFSESRLGTPREIFRRCCAKGRGGVTPHGGRGSESVKCHTHTHSRRQYKAAEPLPFSDSRLGSPAWFRISRVYLYSCLYLHLSIDLSVYIYLSTHLSICRSTSIYLCIYQSNLKGWNTRAPSCVCFTLPNPGRLVMRVWGLRLGFGFWV